MQKVKAKPLGNWNSIARQFDDHDLKYETHKIFVCADNAVFFICDEK